MPVRPPKYSEAEQAIYERANKARLSLNKRLEAKKSSFTFIDLFAGIGGFYYGMTANNGVCVYTNDWNDWSARTYRAWQGDDEVDGTDIREVNYAGLPDHDILCGGFPCQPFSIAGVSKKNSMGRVHGFLDKDQGNLFFAICDLAAVKRPPIMILENVKNLKSHDKGNTFKVICDSLDALGYEMHHKIIDARSWVPQHRERIFLVCFDRQAFTTEEIASFAFPEPPVDGPVLGSILEAKPDERFMLTDGLWSYLQEHARKHKDKGNGFGYQIADRNGVSRTLSARYYKDGSEVLIDEPGWRNPRRLTPLEAARLQGFDSTFAGILGHGERFPQVVSDMQSYKQFGNAVCPHVTQAVGQQAVRVLLKRRRRLEKSGLA